MLKHLVLLLFSWGALAADLPQELDCPSVQIAMQGFLSNHLVFNQLTPELERRTVEHYLKRMDGGKSYLFASDFAAIEKSTKGLFAKIKSGDCSPLVQAHDILLKRMNEAQAMVTEILGPDFKLKMDEKFESDGDKRKRPANAVGLKRTTHNQLQFAVANFVASGVGLEQAKKHVLKNYERALKHEQGLKNKDLFGAYLNDFAAALDPHSEYMPAEAHEDFEIAMSLSLEGIGATLGWKNGFTIVEALLPGGAAARSGQIKRKDKIVAVAQGKDGPMKDVIEVELRDVIKLIRGPKGTDVRLKIVRREKEELKTFEVSLQREKIKLEDQAAFLKLIDQKTDKGSVKVALINLPSFYDDLKKGGKSATSDLRRLIEDAKKAEAKALVLDLSGNGGGSLQDAVEVAGLFFGSGNVVGVGGRGETFQALADADPAVQWPGPLVIWTSRVSASASEIVSGALKDYHRAVIVGGDHTFGKGTVQAIERWTPSLGALKTTTAMFYTAGGYSTQHRGVPGDIVFPSALAHDKISEQSLPNSLPGKKREPFLSSTANVFMGPGEWQLVNKDMIDHLKAKSEKRMAQSKDFKKIRDDLKKDKKPPTLISIGDLVKGKNLDAELDEDADEPDVLLSRDERIKKYMERPETLETVQIAADLIKELRP